MAEVITVNDGDFVQSVVKSETPVLVDFWATWCRPCTMIAPILDELAKEYGDKIKFARLDVDKNPQAAAQYHIMSIPTLIIFKNGEPAAHIVGFRPKAELQKSIDSVLAG